MATHEKTIELLLELSNPAERRTRSEAIAQALRTAITLLDADAASVVLASPRSRAERLILYAGSDTPAMLPWSAEPSEALRALTAERRPLALPDLSDNPAFATADACPGVEAGPVLFVPVDRRDPQPGFLAIYRRRGRARYSAAETELVLLLGAWLSATLEALRMTARSGRLKIAGHETDADPALPLKATLKRELRRAGRHGQELSVLWIEVDGMDAFLEAHGPVRRRPLLKEFASLLAQQVRSFDSFGGGARGRFLAVLPQTGPEGARRVAERMRAAIAEHAFAPAAAGQVTATIGIATFPQNGTEADALLSLAERALEQGRAQGRNRVTTSTRKAA